MNSPAAQGERLHWPDLPDQVRADITALLGAQVVAAETQPHGFSPGVATRLRLADGRRAFVKAVCASSNAEAPDMHRKEARLTAAFPSGVPVPRLLGTHDDGEWVALAYVDVDVDGRPPTMPWRINELEHVMASLVRLHEVLTPCPVPDWPRAADDPGLAADFSWSACDPDALDDGTRGRLDELASLASGWRDAANGDTLLHLDLRADNMLIRPDGGVVFVDWPWGMRGAPLLDIVGFAPSVLMQGGPDLGWLLAGHPAATRLDNP